LASPGNASEGTHTLPRPELNPLMNPLLAENMGRWAEVYFTAAPEKREEAVMELLHQLELENASAQKGPPAPDPADPDPADIERGEETVAETTVARVEVADGMTHCDTCGHDNLPGHQFCGMCGVPLNETARVLATGVEDQEAQEANPVYVESSGPASPTYEEIRPDAAEPVRDPYDLSLFQSLRGASEYESFGDERPASVRYRYYFAAILAILILGLGYMAWRSAHANQEADDTPPLAPPAETAAPAPADSGATSSATKPEKVQEPAPSAPAKRSTAAPAKTQSTSEQSDTTRGRNDAASAKPASTPSTSIPKNTTTSPDQQSGNGGEELALAERYLAGRNGQARDPAEAAKWLWKSMAKHNGPAALLLADLYLKGDGVPKNCDQARLLLDSAAQRGMTGAGARIRNLQAFGCQ